MKRIAIIFNIQSGAVNRLEEIKLFCGNLPKEKFQTEIRETNEHEKVEDIAVELSQSKFDIIVVAGGDGTINTVAKTLLNTKKALGILPIGSLNHLAKDLKIPLNMTDAMKLITDDHDIIDIDVGSCNEHIFLNNSGLGIYPRIIELREKFMKDGHLKWSAFIFALFHIYKNIPKFFIRIKSGDEMILKKTSFIFVGNNIYGLGGVQTGTRASLSDGLLSFWISHRTSALGLIELFFRAMVGNVKEHRDFDVFESEKITVETKRKNSLVSFDGEIVEVESPLRYKIIPKCLNVIVPKT